MADVWWRWLMQIIIGCVCVVLLLLICFNVNVIDISSTIFSSSDFDMFVGIQFSEKDGGGIALVHRKWLTPRKSEVWWPPFKQQEYFNKSIKKGESPNDTWKLFGVVKSFFEEEDYNKALKKIKKAEVTSDFASGDDEPLPRKRKIVPPKRLFSSSDEEDDTELRHPLPPKVKAISHLLKSNKTREINTGSPHRLESQTYEDVTVTSQERSLSRFQEQEQNDEDILNSTLSQKSLRLSYPQNSENSERIWAKSLNLSEKVDEHKETLTSNKENIDCNKKILTLLIQIKNQNSEIIHLLQQKKSATGLHLDLPADIPVTLPLQNLREVRVLEEYLDEEKNLSSMASYFATIGGRDITNKINSILKNLMTNRIASEYSFLGTRNEKQSFQKLKLRKVVLNAVLSTCSSATENEIDDRIKVWLKHAPKRLSTQQAKQDRQNH